MASFAIFPESLLTPQMASKEQSSLRKSALSDVKNTLQMKQAFNLPIKRSEVVEVTPCSNQNLSDNVSLNVPVLEDSPSLWDCNHGTDYEDFSVGIIRLETERLSVEDIVYVKEGLFQFPHYENFNVKPIQFDEYEVSDIDLLLDTDSFALPATHLASQFLSCDDSVEVMPFSDSDFEDEIVDTCDF